MRLQAIVATFALIFTLASASRAQSVLTGSFPGNWGAAAAPPAVPLGGGSSGNVPPASINSGAFYDGAVPSSGLTLLGYEARAVEDNVGATDSFRFRITQEQSFTLAEAAMVAIPMFTSGSITIGGPPFHDPAPSNFAFGEAIATATIYDAAGTAQLTVSRKISAFAPTTGSIPLASFFDYKESAASLAAGTYRLRATMEIGGEGGSISSLPGASVNVDFFDNAATAQRQGLAVSLGTYKAGLPGSRAAVKAPAARSDFSVDGTGVIVGLLETDLPYTTHTSLPASRLTNLMGTIVKDYAGEHALATAGIIAADDPNVENAGIAPKAKIVAANDPSYTTSTAGALAALVGAKVNVISESAGTKYGAAAPPFAEQLQLNQFVNANPLITFVQSAGNYESSPTDSVNREGHAENVLTVGALNRDFTFRAAFSSYSHGAPTIKPDMVAPGEYITAPQSQDTNGDGSVNDFGKVFMGDDFSRASGATTGDVTGTSFATPMVAGAAALLNDYAIHNPTKVDATSVDHRVLKAVLLNSASTAGLKHGDKTTPWKQIFGSADHVLILQSLDTELGAGMLDTYEALRTFSSGEARPLDDNSARNFVITPPTFGEKSHFWDLENSVGKEDGIDGTVDYILGGLIGAHLRATLTWDAVVNAAGTGQVLNQLELRLYQEGGGVGNPHGFDPANPTADFLLAETSGPAENVKLIDWVVSSTHTGDMYLQVFNNSTATIPYGLAVQVPEPGLVVMMLLLTPLLRRRR